MAVVGPTVPLPEGGPAHCGVVQRHWLLVPGFVCLRRLGDRVAVRLLRASTLTSVMVAGLLLCIGLLALAGAAVRLR